MNDREILKLIGNRSVQYGLDAAGAYLLLTVVFTYPLAFGLGRSLPDHDADTWVSLWNDRWFQRCMTGGQSCFSTPDLPMGRRASKRWMYDQTRHGKPLVEGMTARTPETAYDYIHAHPLLESLATGADLSKETASLDDCDFFRIRRPKNARHLTFVSICSYSRSRRI